MGRVELMIVPDEGAGEMVRAALVEAGIDVQVERAYAANPFQTQVLAEPWRILVPEERVADARLALARLEHDVAQDLEAQAAAHARENPPPPARPPRSRSKP
jgi:hypothetical protein